MAMTAVTATSPTNDGDLPSALLRATAEVIIERGLGSFSLREVARRAGVSHAAPGYHFGDMEGLLTALAIEGFSTLDRELEAAAAGVDDCRERLTVTGRAYVSVCMENPAHMEVAFRDDFIDANNLELRAAGQRAFAVLEGTIREIASVHNADLDVRVAAQLCWSAMQGLVQLHPKMMLLNDYDGLQPASTDDLVARFTDLILAGIIHPTA